MLMATRDPSPDEGSSHIRHADQMRQAFRWLNRFMISLWRLGLGGLLNSWPADRGRRSGRQYRTPLNYAMVKGDIYCLAGFGRATDWYRNALATPNLQVWMRDGWWEASAVDVTDAPQRIQLIRAVLIGSGFATYVAGINPRRLSDVQLDEKTSDYRLLKLERMTARTGPGGPGDLAWVWPWAAGLLLLVFRRRWPRAEELPDQTGFGFPT
jgi:deazaflavin-dependent oxidoreductase (nitroreductase family)